MRTHGERGNRKTQDKLRTSATKRTIPWAMPSAPAEAASFCQERKAPPTKAIPSSSSANDAGHMALSSAFGVIGASGKAMVVRDMAAASRRGRAETARGSELRGSS